MASHKQHPLSRLLPSMTAEEYAALRDDIHANGLLQPITLLDGQILDGWHRYRACADVGVMPRFEDFAGDDPLVFVLSANLHRRHLTTGQRALLALEIEALYTREARKRQAHGRTAPGRSATLVDDRPQVSGKARDQAGAVLGVSGRAVGRAKCLVSTAPDLAARVRAGDLALDRACRIERDRTAEERRVERARVEASPTAGDLVLEVRHGDFRHALGDIGQVDAVVTDPPYQRRYLPLLRDLAAWADERLAPDGVLAVLLGQTWLPEAFAALGGHRQYRWTACYLTPRQGSASARRRVQSGWRPLLIYGGGPWFGDVIHSESTGDEANDLHRYGQNFSGFCTIVERLTAPGQLLVDPFCGSGTTLAAAHALGRSAIGCDIDAEAVAVARRRVRAARRPGALGGSARRRSGQR